ncbi:MAG: hypothetical protein EXS60_02150 [Candidatus Pacebacteria bacterium]|nr:hypothetical protein [Candidatus Paceibacterota bacterium]
MTLEQIARLYVIFKTLQPEVKEWIASDDTSAIIKAITARFILSEEQERALPILILRLVTQDLPPESFKAELAKETGVDAELAKNITEAIAKEVIEPIAAALRYGGVNTNLLGFNAPSPIPQPAEQVVSRPTPAPQAEVATANPAEAAPQKAPVTAQPFILHEEPRTTVTPNATRSFNYSPQVSAGETGAVPPRVVIERVVHYSQLRTPLNVASTNKATTANGAPKPKLPQSKWFV